MKVLYSVGLAVAMLFLLLGVGMLLEVWVGAMVDVTWVKRDRACKVCGENPAKGENCRCGLLGGKLLGRAKR